MTEPSTEPSTEPTPPELTPPADSHPTHCQFCKSERFGFRGKLVVFLCGTTVPKNGGKPKCSAGCFMTYNERLRSAKRHCCASADGEPHLSDCMCSMGRMSTVPRPTSPVGCKDCLGPYIGPHLCRGLPLNSTTIISVNPSYLVVNEGQRFGPPLRSIFSADILGPAGVVTTIEIIVRDWRNRLWVTQDIPEGVEPGMSVVWRR